MSSRTVRAWTTLAAFAGGFLAASALTMQAQQGAPLGLSWKGEDGHIWFAPDAADRMYLVVAPPEALDAAEEPPGERPASVSFATQSVRVRSGTAGVTAYAVMPLLSCRAGECEPCSPGNAQPDCGVPPSPWGSGSRLIFLTWHGRKP